MPGSGSDSTSWRTSPRAGRRRLPQRRAVAATSRRDRSRVVATGHLTTPLGGRDLPGLRPFELTWVCGGVDYPQLVEGAADVVLYGPPRPWDHAPGGLLLTEAGGHLGTTDGRDYLPQGTECPGVLAAADRATYDHVVRLLSPRG